MNNYSAPQPTRRERLKPLELIGLSAVLGAFVGLVVLVTTRDVLFAVVAFGIAFIIALVSTALFMLTIKPDALETTDIHTQDEEE